MPFTLQACPDTRTTAAPGTDKVNGGYGQWSNWGECSADCYTAGVPNIQRRIRECNNPVPMNGGLSCINQGLGEAEETRDCLLTVVRFYTNRSH